MQNTFCDKTYDPKSQSTPNAPPDFSLANKFSITIYGLMHLCVIISALLYALYYLSLHKLLVYLPFLYIFYDECREDVTGEYSSAK